MNFIIKNSLLLFSLFLMASCGGGTSEAEMTEKQVKTQDSLNSAIMVVHDEVMPKSADLVRTSASLKKLIPNENVITDDKEIIYTTTKKLDDAEESMMVWMAEYRLPEELRDSMNHEQIMSYLEKEMQRIEKVRSDMNTSLEEGQQLLEQFNKSE